MDICFVYMQFYKYTYIDYAKILTLTGNNIWCDYNDLIQYVA